MKQRSKKKAKKNRKKKGNKSWPQRTKYWMTVGTVSALVACSVADGYAAVRACNPPRILDAIYTMTQGQQPQRFDIPAGVLEIVLTSFQRLTGVQVLIPNDRLRTISSPGVSGVYTVEQALTQVLAGTGSTYRFSGPKVVTLELQGVAASIEGQEQITPSSPKYTEPLCNTPQPISLIPKAVIEEQGVTTLRDVLRNVPGLAINAVDRALSLRSGHKLTKLGEL